jgi:hypothetical protein
VSWTHSANSTLGSDEAESTERAAATTHGRTADTRSNEIMLSPRLQLVT